MKKLLLMLLLTATATFAQQTTKSELAAGGLGKLSVKPDVVKLTLNISKENESEKTALKELNDEVAKLEIFFKKIGLPASNIKIASYSVTEGYRNEKDKQHYVANNSLTIRFKIDNKVLDAFYGELQAGNYKDVYVDYETGLSDELEQKIKAELVTKAIQDAKQNAENIAKALGVKITGVKSVSKFNDRPMYTVEEVKYKDVGRAAMAVSAPPTAFSRYEVEEEERTETINIIFEISK